MTTTQINRLRWQSRRGTLELDLILQKFRRREDLHSPQHLRTFSELFSLDDASLWRLFGSDGESNSSNPDANFHSATARKIADVLRRF